MMYFSRQFFSQTQQMKFNGDPYSKLVNEFYETREAKALQTNLTLEKQHTEQILILGNINQGN